MSHAEIPAMSFTPTRRAQNCFQDSVYRATSTTARQLPDCTESSQLAEEGWPRAADAAPGQQAHQHPPHKVHHRSQATSCPSGVPRGSGLYARCFSSQYCWASSCHKPSVPAAVHHVHVCMCVFKDAKQSSFTYGIASWLLFLVKKEENSVGSRESCVTPVSQSFPKIFFLPLQRDGDPEKKCFPNIHMAQWLTRCPSPILYQQQARNYCLALTFPWSYPA